MEWCTKCNRLSRVSIGLAVAVGPVVETRRTSSHLASAVLGCFGGTDLGGCRGTIQTTAAMTSRITSPGIADAAGGVSDQHRDVQRGHHLGVGEVDAEDVFEPREALVERGPG